MGKCQLLRVLAVGVQDYHGPMQRIGLIGEDIERAVVRIATATATDLRQCQAGEIRPPGEIEQLNLLPIAQARDQTVKASDARARSWVRQMLAQPRSAGLQAPGR